MPSSPSWHGTQHHIFGKAWKPWWAMIIDMGSSESKQRQMDVLLTNLKIPLKISRQNQGQFEDEAQSTITSQLDTIKPVDYWLPVVYGPS